MIHINKDNYAKAENKDFMNRLDFINETGVFVTPIYFDIIADEFKESGLTKEEFIKMVKEDGLDTVCIEEINYPKDEKFKCFITDDDITALSDENYFEDKTIYDIVNDLSEQVIYEREKINKMIKSYDDFSKVSEKYVEDSKKDRDHLIKLTEALLDYVSIINDTFEEQIVTNPILMNAHKNMIKVAGIEKSKHVSNITYEEYLKAEGFDIQ